VHDVRRQIPRLNPECYPHLFLERDGDVRRAAHPVHRYRQRCLRNASRYRARPQRVYCLLCHPGLVQRTASSLMILSLASSSPRRPKPRTTSSSSRPYSLGGGEPQVRQCATPVNAATAWPGKEEGDLHGRFVLIKRRQWRDRRCAELVGQGASGFVARREEPRGGSGRNRATRRRDTLEEVRDLLVLIRVVPPEDRDLMLKSVRCRMVAYIYYVHVDPSVCC
jgi:hypothetical protein